VIPPLLHFTFGFKAGDPFELWHYLAVATAVGVNKPQTTFVYYHHRPQGVWWEQLEVLPSVVTEHVDPPRQIFDRPLCHFAHQSDVVRLCKLLDRGGIYLDMDTICVRPLTPLLQNECVMGVQRGHGLCNAVIMAEPQSVFLTHWRDAYRTFRSTGVDRSYDEHSVLVPAVLAQTEQLRQHITVLDDRAFFFPLWTHLELLFESTDMSLFENSYVVHLWELLTTEPWLRRITMQWLETSPCNYATMARKGSSSLFLSARSAKSELAVKPLVPVPTTNV